MTSETVTRLLDAAQRLVQHRGYNAFSFKDLASEVGIRTASVHYHFPTKSDLGLALMERYQAHLETELARLRDRSCTAKGRLNGLIKLYVETEASGAICMCGSLASDHETLGPDLNRAVSCYLDRTESWVAEVIQGGIDSGDFNPKAKASELASLLLSSLQGALILSRARNANAPLLSMVQRTFLKGLH